MSFHVVSLVTLFCHVIFFHNFKLICTCMFTILTMKEGKRNSDDLRLFSNSRAGAVIRASNFNRSNDATVRTREVPLVHASCDVTSLSRTSSRFTQ